ncbi:CBBY-like protein isoform X2 [Tripterygium wilfordii]|uniref:CBBY-like protein isoform X2 n=1 Tax=Tripterygium wilfordii TaxID=458696 RepID=UPI0018F81BB5|nr:CBBY-like protein isoform X2 [Tripterygium wilfordii]
MTAYFNKTGWPENAPKSEEEGKEFIASLHKRKTELFISLIEKRLLPLWPGFSNSFVLAGTRASRKIKIFAGDVVPSKKPDPAIYVLAAKTLGVDPSSYTAAEEDFLNTDAVFDCIRDSPEERFDLAFFVRLLEKQKLSATNYGSQRFNCLIHLAIVNSPGYPLQKDKSGPHPR